MLTTINNQQLKERLATDTHTLLEQVNDLEKLELPPAKINEYAAIFTNAHSSDVNLQTYSEGWVNWTEEKHGMPARLIEALKRQLFPGIGSATTTLEHKNTWLQWFLLPLFIALITLLVIVGDSDIQQGFLPGGHGHAWNSTQEFVKGRETAPAQLSSQQRDLEEENSTFMCSILVDAGYGNIAFSSGLTGKSLFPDKIHWPCLSCVHSFSIIFCLVKLFFDWRLLPLFCNNNKQLPLLLHALSFPYQRYWNG